MDFVAESSSKQTVRVLKVWKSFLSILFFFIFRGVTRTFALIKESAHKAKTVRNNQGYRRSGAISWDWVSQRPVIIQKLKQVVCRGIWTITVGEGSDTLGITQLHL